MNNSLYTRPDKPRTMLVSCREQPPEMAVSLPEPVAVDSATECHVTPPAVAARMVDYLGVGDYLTLEPSGGTGNLVQALFDGGHSVNELTVIERHNSLCTNLFIRFKEPQRFEPINRCFLEYAEEAKGKIEFPRIIMNPPFKGVKKHINAALSLLGCAGHRDAVLVALVPITYQHEEAEELETLPNNTFLTAKVNTKIIRFVQ